MKRGPFARRRFRMAPCLEPTMRDREDADYATGAVFTDEEAPRIIADAQASSQRPVD